MCTPDKPSRVEMPFHEILVLNVKWFLLKKKVGFWWVPKLCWGMVLYCSVKSQSLETTSYITFYWTTKHCSVLKLSSSVYSQLGNYFHSEFCNSLLTLERTTCITSHSPFLHVFGSHLLSLDLPLLDMLCKWNHTNAVFDGWQLSLDILLLRFIYVSYL